MRAIVREVKEIRDGEDKVGSQTSVFCLSDLIIIS